MELTLHAAAFVRPCVGERLSGDGTLIEKRGGLTCAILIDGLGHGRHAHEACSAGLAAVKGRWTDDPGTTMTLLHEGLKKTIGAVGAVCIVDEKTGNLAYSGVGNTVFRILGKEARTFSSVPGTLGKQMRVPRVDRMTLRDDDILILHSDGISDRTPVSEYPEMRIHSVQTIVRTMVKRFGRTFDDVSCIAMRYA